MEGNKKKILMIGPARSVRGGISEVVNNYYRVGIEDYIDINYIATMVDGSKFRKLVQALYAYMRAIVCMAKVDMVHIHMASDASLIRKLPMIWLARIYGKRIIIHQHGGDIINYYDKDISELLRYIIRSTLRMADIMIVLTKSWKEYFANIIEEHKIVVVPNGVIVDDYHYTNKDYNNKRIAYLGRLTRDKGIGELLDSMQEVAKTYPQAMLYLAGTWSEDELRVKADNNPNVKYIGWIGNKKKISLLEHVSIVVIPSYYEGQPMVMLEAMAAGCAIIASEVGGIPDVVRDGEQGLLVAPRDSGVICEALNRLLEDDRLVQRLAGHARELVESDYNLKYSINTLVKLWER